MCALRRSRAVSKKMNDWSFFVNPAQAGTMHAFDRATVPRDCRRRRIAPEHA
jgi:hypothetical protein